MVIEYKCKICEKEFSDREELAHHVLGCAPKTNEPKPINLKDYSRCKYCNDYFLVKGVKVHEVRCPKNPNRIKTGYKVKVPVAAPPKLNPQTTPIEQIKTDARPVIQWCGKCAIIWDGPTMIKFCPDCGTELKQPLKRKSFKVGL